MANQLFDLKPGSPTVDAREITGADGAKWVDYTHTFNSLGFAGITIPYATLHLIPDKMGKAVRADNERQDYTQLQLKFPQVLLGIADLKHLHLCISYKEKLLYVTAAEQQ